MRRLIRSISVLLFILSQCLLVVAAHYQSSPNNDTEGSFVTISEKQSTTVFLNLSDLETIEEDESVEDSSEKVVERVLTPHLNLDHHTTCYSNSINLQLCNCHLHQYIRLYRI